VPRSSEISVTLLATIRLLISPSAPRMPSASTKYWSVSCGG
jgi:hypothetical protein